ncbi:phosphoribosylamine--glycine ligase [bacterium]|nr:phosphoribosylamine--glycine ligase [bacterium]|tara:strand:+ start:2849 stop:4162 length:1314 start_codon:yes stop_codon:yes gene_type:complete
MRILFISGELIGSAVVHQLIQEGNEVKLYIEHPDRADCFDGFVEKVTNWKEELDWVGKDGLIIFDDIVFNGVQKTLREKGYSVMGGDAESDKLEEDRYYFQALLERFGIPILPHLAFNKPEDAIKYVQQNRGQWVVKQNSHIGMLNYVGERDDGEDVIDVLELYKESKIRNVHLQKRALGIEIGVGRYFNGHDWVGPIEVNIEHKPLFNGDIGPLTAEMGTVMWYSDNEEMRLYKETLAKFKPYLKEIAYKGDIDINCIVNEDGIWPLEATMRFGTPAAELQCHLHNSPWSDFLKAIADGDDFELDFKKGYGVVVSVGVPPFPFAPEVFKENDTGLQTSKGIGIFFTDDLTEDDRSGIHFEEVSRRITPDGKERYYLAGRHGYALYVTGHGETVSEARDKAYAILKKIIIPKMFYRTDIGQKFIDTDFKLLADWNVI